MSHCFAVPRNAAAQSVEGHSFGLVFKHQIEMPLDDLQFLKHGWFRQINAINKLGLDGTEHPWGA